jgi:beta-phosphoglucomutase-like phosphatase (HAD superfamily)
VSGTGPLITLSPQDWDAVLFDMDGVLTRTADVHARAWKKLFDDFLERHAQVANVVLCAGDDALRVIRPSGEIISHGAKLDRTVQGGDASASRAPV